MRRLLLPLLVIAAMWPAAAARANPASLLTALAQRQTHSYLQDSVPPAQLLANYHAGRRLYVTCGTVVEVGRLLLQENGYRSRIAQVVTREPWNGSNDGHIMLEVHRVHATGWVLWDLDSNRRAVSATGRSIDLVSQVAAIASGRWHWRTIAHDPLFSARGATPQLAAATRKIFAHPRAFDRRVMDVAILPVSPTGDMSIGAYFHDTGMKATLESYSRGTWQWVDAARWEGMRR